jgi:selenide, water dikinase
MVAIRLTEFARGGGCAAKLRLGDLSTMLAEDAQQAKDFGAGTTQQHGNQVLIDHTFSDDAAVATVTPGTNLVLTTDVIAPLVDDPETFGAIAATNAMSDVWAMGGEPRYALNLVFFSDDNLPMEVLYAILRGGRRACHNAGVAVVGGHSVRDPEVKFGLAVTGEVNPSQVWSNRNATAGCRLILSKALGTGVLSQAIKTQTASAEQIAAAVASMTTLNQGAALIGHRFGVKAATDITGFGLCGHLRNLVRESDLVADIELSALPLLPGVKEHFALGLCPGGSKANREFVAPMVTWSGGDALAPSCLDIQDRAEQLASIACDAQTSGGLLLCVPSPAAADCLDALRQLGLPAADIGALRHAETVAVRSTIRLHR